MKQYANKLPSATRVTVDQKPMPATQSLYGKCEVVMGSAHHKSTGFFAAWVLQGVSVREMRVPPSDKPYLTTPAHICLGNVRGSVDLGQY